MVYTKENLLVKATPYPEVFELGVGGRLLSLEIRNVGSVALASTTLKVQYHPQGEWWNGSLTGSLLVRAEGAALATLAPGTSGVSILDFKGIYAIQLTFLCAGNWNTTNPNAETYLNIYGFYG